MVVTGFLAAVAMVAISCSDSNGPADPTGSMYQREISSATTAGGDGPSIVVLKFYDTNGDGIKDADEPLLTGWPISIDAIPVGETPVTYPVDPGAHRVCEYVPPVSSGWVPTTPTCVTVEVDECGGDGGDHLTSSGRIGDDAEIAGECTDEDCDGFDDADGHTPCVDCVHCPDNPLCDPKPTHELCCIGGETCIEVEIGQCGHQGGVVVQSCTECGGPSTELCCIGGNTCVELTAEECGHQGGEVVASCDECGEHEPCTPDTVWFGNLCVAGGVGKTPGFWHNRNGQRVMDAADVTALAALCLRNADGSDFNPTTKAQVGAWINSQDATNMAAKLSSFVAAMTLNIRHGYVNADALVYTGSGVDEIGDVLAAGAAAICADGYTPSGDEPNRSNQAAIKDILDKACNNQNFVRTTPCEVPHLDTATMTWTYSRF
jgi:hypothetical protein